MQMLFPKQFGVIVTSERCHAKRHLVEPLLEYSLHFRFAVFQKYGSKVIYQVTEVAAGPQNRWKAKSWEGSVAGERAYAGS